MLTSAFWHPLTFVSTCVNMEKNRRNGNGNDQIWARIEIRKGHALVE